MTGAVISSKPRRPFAGCPAPPMLPEPCPRFSAVSSRRCTSCCGLRRRWRKRRRGPWRGAPRNARTRECKRGPSACMTVTPTFKSRWPTQSAHQQPLGRLLDARLSLQDLQEQSALAVRRPGGLPGHPDVLRRQWSNTESGHRSAARGPLEIPRPCCRRIAGGKRPFAHVVDGWPRRGPLVLVDLIDRARGRRRFAGMWFGHVDQFDPGSSRPQWSHASRQLPFRRRARTRGEALPDGSTTGAGCTLEPM
jgi:hypothetical protein